MKKTILLLIGVIALVSCGKDKEEVKDNAVAEVVNKFSLEIDAIYEKNDSINVSN